VPKATATISGIRPSGLTGAPAPRPLTQWIEHLKRTRLAAKKARGIQRQRRVSTQKRLAEAEHLIGQVIDGADVIAQGAARDAGGAYPAVYLLVTLHSAHFNDLAIFGSEIEDMEDSHDQEATPFDDREEDRSDDEPSTEYGAKDQAIIEAARARYKKPPEPERRGALTYATVDPETGRAGAWVLQRRKGGGR
jgi:hypothetical protein